MDEAREPLADYAHSAWAGWMRYLFGKSIEFGHPHPLAGGVIIEHKHVGRWKRQMETPYAELPETEKESDRAEADKILAIVRQPDALALATASLLDQAAGVAELLQEAGKYIDHLLATAPIYWFVSREAGTDLVRRIADALGGEGAPGAACPACGAPMLRRAGKPPLCPNDLCRGAAEGAAWAALQQEEDAERFMRDTLS